MNQDSAAPLLELKDVVTDSMGYEILRGASCVFRGGRTAFIMGTPGSGKSTLIKAAAGLVVPDAGEVLLAGRSLQSLGRRELQSYYFRTGFAFQDSALWANQSIRDNMSLPLRIMDPRAKKAELDGKITKALEALDYRESLSERPSQLSSGEQKLVSIARAIVTDPEILFLDEPMAFLNDASCQRVMDLVLEFKRRGRTIVIVSHSTYFARIAADDMIIMHQGRVVARGEYETILDSEDPVVRGIMHRSAQRERNAAAASTATATAANIEPVDEGGRSAP